MGFGDGGPVVVAAAKALSNLCVNSADVKELVVKELVVRQVAGS